MYKRFRTVSGKRVKIKMTAEEAWSQMAFNVLVAAGGLFLGFLVWGAI